MLLVAFIKIGMLSLLFGISKLADFPLSVVDGPFFPRQQQWLDIEGFTHMRDNDISELLVIIQDFEDGAGNCHYTRRFINDNSVADPRYGFHNSVLNATSADERPSLPGGPHVPVDTTGLFPESRTPLHQIGLDNSPVDRSSSASAPRPDFPDLITNDYSVYRARTRHEGWQIAIFARPRVAVADERARLNATQIRSLAERLRYIAQRQIPLGDRNDYVWRAHAHQDPTVSSNQLQEVHAVALKQPRKYVHKFIRNSAWMQRDSSDTLDLSAATSPGVHDGFDLQSSPRDPMYSASTQIAASMAIVFDGIFVIRDVHTGGDATQRANENILHKYSIKIIESIVDIPTQHQAIAWKGKLTKIPGTPKALVLFTDQFSPYQVSDHAPFDTFFREDIFNDLKLDLLKDVDVTPAEVQRASMLQAEPFATHPSRSAADIAEGLFETDQRRISLIVEGLISYFNKTVPASFTEVEAMMPAVRQSMLEQRAAYMSLMEQKWAAEGMPLAKQKLFTTAITEKFVMDMEQVPASPKHQKWVDLCVAVFKESLPALNQQVTRSLHEFDVPLAVEWLKNQLSHLEAELPLAPEQIMLIESLASQLIMSLPLEPGEKQDALIGIKQAAMSLSHANPVSAIDDEY